MGEIWAMIRILPINAEHLEAELKNLFRVANDHLEAFAKSRLLFIRHPNEGLKEKLAHHCDMVASQSFLL